MAKIKKSVLKGILNDYVGMKDAGRPPVLSLALYERVMQIIAGGYKLRALDVRIIMLVDAFKGISVNQIVIRAGMHRKSIYTVIDRLILKGYIYEPKSKWGRVMEPTEAGTELIHEVNRVWDTIVREAISRNNTL